MTAFFSELPWAVIGSTAFLVLLAAHVVHALLSVWQDRNREAAGQDSAVVTVQQRRWGLITQVPLFYVALAIGFFVHGAISRQLISPVHIAGGLLAGHAIFGLSLLITHRHFGDAWEHFIDLGGLWDYAMESPTVFGRFIIVAFSEELIWRVVFQPMAVAGFAALAPQGAWWPIATGLGLTSVLFAVTHKHFFENSWLVSLEFLGFAVLLSVLYWLTGSFILVLVVHALRDVEITFLEYAATLDEMGDPDAAARAVERTLRFSQPDQPQPEQS